jgi:NADPH-dependent 2,4-dienoyl-CoA reductase/sulfur reductase-like enzyme
VRSQDPTTGEHERRCRQGPQRTVSVRFPWPTTRPTTHHAHMTRVAIIGGGILGCAIGWELVKRGIWATVLDKNGDVGHGSTSASCGIVRRFYSTPTMTGMAEEGAHTWANWRQLTLSIFEP